MLYEDHPYAFLCVFLGLGLLFPLVPLALARFWAGWMSPAKPGPEKNAAFECGVPSVGVGPVQFKSEYYLYAIIFLIFDVEAVFLLPFATAFLDLSVGGFVAILVFLLLLLEGLAWAWMKGLLNWK